ncbi:YafY family protein [Paenibacillus sp. DCT19]|uniref:helix-turn-helix transcriptional regulator n=1 Tax=Paenibacillus sp. DCT19 TaxID=2211212 RepID=UPI000FE275E9|nr:WYL domain-containing protein [Paenibacillus sp. DCT19]
MHSEDKVTRILILYDKLMKGEILNKHALASNLGVNGRSIQRDIDDIRVYLSEQHSGEDVIYDHSKKGYLKTEIPNGRLTAVEILAITKIMLESRAFQKDEMQGLIKAIVNQAEVGERKALQGAINNELHHYKPLTHNKPLLKLIWDINSCIRRQQQIEITYERMDGNQSVRRVKPVSIIFSEFYFYLVAYISESRYEYPAYFRIDRIKLFKLIKEQFSISEKERVQTGEIRNRSQFMYAGELINLKFNYYGSSLSAVLDRLPNAQVSKGLDCGYLIEAKVYGEGCLMWLLSQGSNVEVLSPKSLREKMKNTIQEMSSRYKE